MILRGEPYGIHASRKAGAFPGHFHSVVPALVAGTYWRQPQAMRYRVYILASSKHGTPRARKVRPIERDNPEWKDLYERING